MTYRLTLAALAIPLLLATGCVERKMLIRTDPPDAIVTLNRARRAAGRTPLEIPFDFYGTYDVRIQKKGYATLHTTAPVPTPWYSYPVLDFFTELVLPVTIHDDREFVYHLKKLPPAEKNLGSAAANQAALEKARKKDAELLDRAKELRRRVDEGNPAEIR